MPTDPHAYSTAVDLRSQGWITVPVDPVTHLPRRDLDSLLYEFACGAMDRADYDDAAIAVLVGEDSYMVLGAGESIAQRIENGREYLAGQCFQCEDPIATNDPDVDLERRLCPDCIGARRRCSTCPAIFFHYGLPEDCTGMCDDCWDRLFESDG
jgi:hypothetical protein